MTRSVTSLETSQWKDLGEGLTAGPGSTLGRLAPPTLPPAYGETPVRNHERSFLCSTSRFAIPRDLPPFAQTAVVSAVYAVATTTIRRAAVPGGERVDTVIYGTEATPVYIGCFAE